MLILEDLPTKISVDMVFLRGGGGVPPGSLQLKTICLRTESVEVMEVSNDTQCLT